VNHDRLCGFWDMVAIAPCVDSVGKLRKTLGIDIKPGVTFTRSTRAQDVEIVSTRLGSG